MIAAIHGYCVGGGLEIALASDIRIAAENATFGAPEVKWNRLFGFGTLNLIRAIPLANAMEMLLTGERIDAKEAYRIGLVSRVVSREELMPTAIKIAKQICENSPLAVQLTKELALRGRNMLLADGLRYFEALERIMEENEDTRGGPTAFAEKKQPDYKPK